MLESISAEVVMLKQLIPLVLSWGSNNIGTGIKIAGMALADIPMFQVEQSKEVSA